MSHAAALPESKALDLRAFFSGKGWAGHLGMLALGWAIVLGLFANDFADMGRIWWTDTTFNHCLFIPFLSLWLAHQRRAEVAQIAPHGWAPGALLVFGAALLWLIGDAAGVGLVRQTAVVLMLQAMVPTLLGPNVARAMLFPLFYLFFMVPAGVELVPLLQTITADMSMALLALVNIPASINGIFITTPTGYFEVAVACSGIKFLVAMVAYGALVANVCFVSWPRRIAFMALCVVVPVLANGVRAFATIYAAHLTSVEAATGFDHILYGWFFFGFVMLLVMGIGWKFFDRKLDDPWLVGFRLWSGLKALCPRRALAFAGVALAIPLLWQVVMAATGRSDLGKTPVLAAPAGWSAAPLTNWVPRYKGADRIVTGHYRNAAGDVVTLSVVLFGWQEEGRELVSYGQGAWDTDTDGEWLWAANTAPWPGGFGERIVARGPVNREVATFYQTADGLTGSKSAVKLATLKHRLLGGDQAVAAILVSAEDREDRPARPAIAAFLQAMGSPEVLGKRMLAEARGR